MRVGYLCVMTGTRREVLRNVTAGVSVCVLGSAAGCVGNGENGEGEDDSDGGNRTIGEFTIPNPVITSVEIPNVDVTEVEDTTRDGEDVMKATLTNSGAKGSVSVEGYWVPDGINSMEEVDDKSDLEKFSQEEVMFENSETISYSVTETMPDEYDTFIFHTIPLNVNVVVTNNGGAGDVVVTLDLEDNPEERRLTLEENEERTLSFELPRQFNTVNEIPVGARTVESTNE